MCGSLHFNVNLYACIPFVNIRNVTRTGVLRLGSIRFGESVANLGPAISGLFCGSDTGLVMQLGRNQYNLIADYLKADGSVGDDVEQAIQRRKV